MTPMPDDRTDLLPSERRAAAARDYALRLGVVTTLVATSLTFVALVLLFPAHVFLTRKEIAERARLENIESAVPSTGETAVSARLGALAANADALAALGSTRSPSALLRSLLAIPHPGLALSGFAYAAASGGKQPETLTVSGQARTREALRVYQLALEGAPFVRSAVLPVSAYAKDTDIPFTIVLSLSP